MEKFTIEIPELDKTLAKLERAPIVIRKHTKDAMHKSTLIVEADTKKDWPVGVSGQSRNSIGSQVTETTSTVTGKVGSNIVSPYPYPLIIELGRKPGRMPPPAALMRWVELVMGVKGEQTAGVAFLVARSIARRGIKGKHLLKKAYESNKTRILNFFDTAMKRIVEELGRWV